MTVANEVDDANDENARLEHREVLVRRGGEDQPPEALVVEQRLDDDQASDQVAASGWR